MRGDARAPCLAASESFVWRSAAPSQLVHRWALRLHVAFDRVHMVAMFPSARDRGWCTVADLVTAAAEGRRCTVAKMRGLHRRKSGRDGGGDKEVAPYIDQP
jgi:hypothetical protein